MNDQELLKNVNPSYTTGKGCLVMLAGTGDPDAIAKDLCTFFHQESVLITENKIRAYYIKEKPFEY